MALVRKPVFGVPADLAPDNRNAPTHYFLGPQLSQGNKQRPRSIAVDSKEHAARLGYLDAQAGIGFRQQYDSSAGPWQRNYELGRLWATGIAKCGLACPEWPEGANQQPVAINDALRRVNSMMPGLLDPKGSENYRPDDPNLGTLHKPLRIVRGRLMERR